ncbi:hypothetical protein EON63_19020 [archaeon]|nr:MAG: hypothetical protein EON63_19020 [archaeon]
MQAYLQTRYYNHWCGDGLQYLDDSNCVKIFPTVHDRDWTCGAKILTTPPAGYTAESDLPSVLPSIDTKSLFINDTDLHVCVILTKRVANSSSISGVTLYNKYFCSGDWSRSEPFEPWSRYNTYIHTHVHIHIHTLIYDFCLLALRSSPWRMLLVICAPMRHRLLMGCLVWMPKPLVCVWCMVYSV